MTVNPAAIASAQMQYENRKKNSVATWLLWLFTGGLGGHRYYLGDIGYAIGMTLTLGGLGIWSLIDAFFIPGRMGRKNEEIRRQVFIDNGLQDPVLAFGGANQGLISPASSQHPVHAPQPQAPTSWPSTSSTGASQIEFAETSGHPTPATERTSGVTLEKPGTVS